MRMRARTDANHQEIVSQLRQCGYSVQSLASIGSGCPDIVVGAHGRNYLFEIKDGKKCPSGRRLTSDEEQWHFKWGGQVSIIYGLDDAIRTINAKI